MESDKKLISTPRDIQKILESVLFSLGTKCLNEIPNISFIDLGAASAILQRLIDCYLELKPLAEKSTSSKAISQDVINAIQSQLNLL